MKLIASLITPSKVDGVEKKTCLCIFNDLIIVVSKICVEDEFELIF